MVERGELAVGVGRKRAELDVEIVPLRDLGLKGRIAGEPGHLSVIGHEFQRLADDVELAFPFLDLALAGLALADHVGGRGVKAGLGKAGGAHGAVVVLRLFKGRDIDEFRRRFLAAGLAGAAGFGCVAAALLRAAGREREDHHHSEHRGDQRTKRFLHCIPPKNGFIVLYRAADGRADRASPLLSECIVAYLCAKCLLSFLKRVANNCFRVKMWYNHADDPCAARPFSVRAPPGIALTENEVLRLWLQDPIF